MSKKFNIIFSIIFIFILGINFINYINNENSIKTVFSEVNNDKEYDYYYLTINNLNTKNFNNIFSKLETNDYEITKLYTTPKDTYNDKLISDLKEYSFDNIDNFIKYYIKKLEDYKLEEDINNINVYGIKIDKVLIYMDERSLKDFSIKIGDVEYKKKIS